MFSKNFLKKICVARVVRASMRPISANCVRSDELGTKLFAPFKIKSTACANLKIVI